MADREIEVVIRGKNLSGDAFKQVQKDLGGVAETAKKTSGAMDVAFGVLASTQMQRFADAAKGMLGSIITEASESQATMAQLEAVIASTGGAAGLSADNVADLAQEIAGMTSYEDDAIIAGQTLLLQFDAINKANFDQASQTMVDLATRMKVDIPQAAKMLGRALEGEFGGLSRFGIIIDEATQKQIEGLMEIGNTAEAQGLILDAVAKKVGGAAAAEAKTFKALIQGIKNDFNELIESIGISLEDNPIVTEFLTNLRLTLQGLAKSFDALPDETQAKLAGITVGLLGLIAATPGILALSFVLKPLIGLLGQLVKFSGAKLLPAAFSPAGVVALSALANLSFQNWGMKKAAEEISKFAETLGIELPEAYQKWLDKVKEKGYLWVFNAEARQAWVEAWKSILSGLGEAWDDFWKGIKWPEIKWPKIEPPAIKNRLGGGGASAPQITAVPGLDEMKGRLQELQGLFTALQQRAGTFAQSVQAGFANLPAIFQNIINSLQSLIPSWQQVGQTASTIFQNISRLWNTFAQTISRALSNALSAIRRWFSTVYGQFRSWTSNLITYVRNIFQSVGTAIITGIRTGISSGWEGLKTWISNSMNTLLAWVKTKLGIKSPSSLFAEEIGLPLAQGIGLGIERGMADVRGALGSLALPQFAAPTAGFVPQPAYAYARAQATSSNTRISVGRIEVHNPLTQGERYWVRKQSENITERTLSKVLK